MTAKLAIPAIAALALAAGLTATPAAAQHYGSGYGSYHSGRHFHAPHRVCTPIVKWVRVPNRHGHGWHWARIQVGQTCHWVYRR